jgi:delta14-sterol reductase
MLVFGDYVFIPFVFSVQCHYLINYPDLEGTLNVVYFIINMTLFVIGMYIFRKANSQKNQFKT